MKYNVNLQLFRTNVEKSSQKLPSEDHEPKQKTHHNAH